MGKGLLSQTLYAVGYGVSKLTQIKQNTFHKKSKQIIKGISTSAEKVALKTRDMTKKVNIDGAVKQSTVMAKNMNATVKTTAQGMATIVKAAFKQVKPKRTDDGIPEPFEDEIREDSEEDILEPIEAEEQRAEPHSSPDIDADEEFAEPEAIKKPKRIKKTVLKSANAVKAPIRTKSKSNAASKLVKKPRLVKNKASKKSSADLEREINRIVNQVS
ncbi:MAG: hypothetical protein ACI9CF_001333 [Candidatus Omnitrophota bacterium]|jgi:hypothetical protein